MTILIIENHIANLWEASRTIYNHPLKNLSQEKIQSAIEIQPKVMEAIIAADSGHTTYMSNESAKKKIDFYEIFN